MQIVVNARLLLPNRLEGMGWFSSQTLRRITRQNPEVHFVFLFDRPFDEQFIFSDNITPLVVSPQARHPLLYYAWFQHSVKGILNKMEPDLFFSPDGFLSLGAKCPQVPVIHDINFHHHPKDSRWLTSKFYNHYFPRYAKEASRIITVSEYSKADIARSYRITPEKIDVVYNGVNEFFKPVDDFQRQQTRKKFTGGKPYFVCVGSLHPRKNTLRLIEAFDQFKKRHHSDVKLVFAGPGMWGMKNIRQAVEKAEFRSDIVFTERLNDEDLASVMGSALALTYVPYYEGFGIPVVEAMQAGIPVITSNVTSLPEVAGDAALLVNPLSVENISAALTKIYKDEALRSQLIDKGRQQVQKFSWDRTADLVWKSIHKAVRK